MNIEIITCLQDNYSYLIVDNTNNTANLHMCTIKDFFHFVKSKDIKIFKSLALNNLNTSIINESNLGLKNLFADLGIFLIEK